MQASLPSYATLLPDVLIQDFSNEAVLLNIKTNHYYGLDEVGLRCWQLLAEDSSVAKMIEQLLVEYEVDESQLKQDVAKLLDNLVEADLVEVQK